jgi:leader peptidase (prepilin peptidase)/N-methyltransferase
MQLSELAATMVGVIFGPIAVALRRHIPVFLDGTEHHKRSYWREVALGIVAAGAALLSLMVFGLTLKGVGAATFCAALLALAAIDLDLQILPDVLTLPLLCTGLAQSVVHIFCTPNSAVLGAIAGYCMLWIPFHIHLRLTGREGIGRGDMKLAAAIGAWVGLGNIPPLYVATLTLGGVVALARTVLRFKGSTADTQPFGPYLAAAGVVGLFFTASF